MDFSVIQNNLENKGYIVKIFNNEKEDNEYLNNELDNHTICICVTLTVEQLGLYETLKNHNKIYWHWKPVDGLSPDEMRKISKDTDIYFSSVNAISETGEIINIDNNCDRVSNTLFGHKKVYFLVGKNKITKTEEDAVFRARNVAAPLNAQRLNKKTPCAIKADKCYNCKSPDRICRALSILWEKPAGCEYEVIFINKDLGY